jgi:3-oxoacyl-[acyl-carrier-protein] synthase-3
MFIHGMGHWHPETTLDNAFFESLDLGTTDAWVQQRVGIRTRHTALSLDYIRSTRNQDPREAASAASCDGVEMAVRAATMAMTRAGVSPMDIGVVIAGASAAAQTAPATASLVAERLGITAPAFDMNAACSSFVLHASVLASWPFRGLALTVYPEDLTRAVDYRRRDAAVLMGDGAAACIWSKTERGPIVVSDAEFGSDPAGAGKVGIRNGGHLQQDGPAVQAFAVRRSVALVREMRLDNEIFVGHQANLRMLQTVCEHAAIPRDRHFWNVDARGNCGAAGAPSVLSEHWDAVLGSTSDVLVVQVGAGLSWGGFRMRCAVEAALELTLRDRALECRGRT